MKRKKAIIMLHGYPATGKTFMAKRLVNLLKDKYKIINIATLDFRKKFNLFNLESEEQRDKVYDLLAEHLKDVVKNGDYDIIIIDGNFNKRHRREKVYSILGNNTIYCINSIVSNEEVIKERMKERRKNLHIHENKAAIIDLYNLIKRSGDNIEKDDLVKKGIINFIWFNSEKNVIEKISLNNDNIPKVTQDIVSCIQNNTIT